MSFRLACFEQIDEIAQFGTQICDFETHFTIYDLLQSLYCMYLDLVVSFQVAEEDSQVSAEATSKPKPFRHAETVWVFV